jgi:hypothetical protein
VINRRRLAVVLVLIVGVAAALNMTGLLRYPGGPLREPSADGAFWLDVRPPDQGETRVGAGAASGLRAGELIYAGIVVNNSPSSSVLIEGVRLMGATSGLQLVEARLAVPGSSGGLPALADASFAEEFRPATDFQSLPATLVGNGTESERMLLVVTALEPGEYKTNGVAVDYRLGPFTFTVTYHQAMTVCLGPLREGEFCPMDVDGS